MSQTHNRRLGTALMAALLAACTNEKPPSSYDACILSHVPRMTANVGLPAITTACRNSFPSAQQASVVRPLAPTELANLDGKAGVSNGTFSGFIYNGNSNVTVSSVDVEVSHVEKTKPVTRRYRVHADLDPLTAATISAVVVPGSEGAEWNIVGALGR